MRVGLASVVTIALMLFSCGRDAAGTGSRSTRDPMSIRLERMGDSEDTLRISLTNAGRSPVEIIPFFELRNVATGEEYWGPFDERGQPLPLNGRVSKASGVAEITVTLSRLKWARLRAALWPSGKFRDVVPSGKYEVVARLCRVRGKSIESNRLVMTLAVESTK